MTDEPARQREQASDAELRAAAYLAAQLFARSREQRSQLAQQQAVEQATQAPSQQQGLEAVQRGPRLA